MKKIILILLFLCCSKIGICGPVGWTWFEYNGHEYALTNTQSNWASAELEAVSAGGHLVTINDYAENMFIGNTFDDFFTGNYKIAWIGLQGSTSINSWVSGEPVTFTTFSGGYGVNTGTSFYMHLYDTTAYKWNNHVFHDTTDTSKNCLGIIEINPVPEPISMLLFGTGIIGVGGYVRRKLKS
jgi:hypothetical protein